MSTTPSLENKEKPIFFIVENDSAEIVNRKGQPVGTYGYTTCYFPEPETEILVTESIDPPIEDKSWQFDTKEDALQVIDKLESKNKESTFSVFSIQKKTYTFFEFS